MEYLYLLTGLLLLVTGGEYLVRGGVAIAHRAKVPSLIIGMTVIAMGTSFPELIVSLQAAIQGHTEIALGNVIGSNIVNIGLILGVSALIIPLSVQRDSARRDAPFMLACSLLLIGLMADDRLQWYEGLAMLLLFTAFTYVSIRSARKQGQPSDTDAKPPMPLGLAIVVTLASVGALAWGADLLIDSACAIARDLHVPERVISVTLVAVGTSLPELVTSVIAAIRKEDDIAIGNIIGSNIFNVLVVLGLPALIHPIDHCSFESFRPDLIWMTGFALLLWLAILPLKRRVLRHPRDGERFSKLGRASGLLMVAGYAAYLYVLFTAQA